ncbi:MAG: class II fructose-bisphosphate aldolase [Janthinobacterium lividum]
MTLATTADLLADALARGTGLAALNVITLEQAEGTVLGAEQAGLPVVLQVSQNAAKFHLDDPAPLTAALLVLARTSQVDVALHLDHVTRVDLLHRTAECGFSSVMFDAGPLPYSENVAATRDAAAWGREHGLLVEAELGYVGGKAEDGWGQVESAHGSGVRTDPDQAAEYVAATGVDALAVAVGSRHAMTSADAELDLDLVARLRAAVDVPLVLHGSSGVPQPTIAAAVVAGMTKVNIGTITTIAFTRAIRQHLADRPQVSDPRQYLDPARAAVSTLVAELVSTVALAGTRTP